MANSTTTSSRTVWGGNQWLFLLVGLLLLSSTTRVVSGSSSTKRQQRRITVPSLWRPQTNTGVTQLDNDATSIVASSSSSTALQPATPHIPTTGGLPSVPVRTVTDSPPKDMATQQQQQQQQHTLHQNEEPWNQHESFWERQRRAWQSSQSSSFDVLFLPRIKQPSRTSKKKERKQPHKSSSTKQPSGSRLDWRPPSPERIAQWFAPSSVSRGVGRSHTAGRKRQETLFNHDSVGMTNPVLQITLEDNHQDREDSSSSLANLHYDPSSSTASISLTSPASTTAATTTMQQQQQEYFELQDSWIPATSTSTPPINNNNHQNSNDWARVLQYKLIKVKEHYDASREAAQHAWFPSTNAKVNNNNNKRHRQHQHPKWRQCCYRRRVGQGQACYERVRDAALEWQFNHTQHPAKGIIPVPFTEQSQQQQQQQLRQQKQSEGSFLLENGAAQHVQSIWSGVHQGASRRLVTFTTCGLQSPRWLPKLYAMNPVMIVYDLLDQRGPGTTYSSTAYATLKGHWLRGEERVTVALRDDTGYVDVEILSYSRPAGSLKAKMVWPFVGKMQEEFFQDQLDFLESIALPKPPPPPPQASRQLPE